MPCLLTRRACKVCGDFHDFYLAGGEVATDQRYEYQCPETEQVAYLWDITDVRAVDNPPDNGVEIRPTGQSSERRAGV